MAPQITCLSPTSRRCGKKISSCHLPEARSPATCSPDWLMLQPPGLCTHWLSARNVPSPSNPHSHTPASVTHSTSLLKCRILRRMSLFKITTFQPPTPFPWRICSSSWHCHHQTNYILHSLAFLSSVSFCQRMSS
jgi:hypothetical protein